MKTAQFILDNNFESSLYDVALRLNDDYPVWLVLQADQIPRATLNGILVFHEIYTMVTKSHVYIKYMRTDITKKTDKVTPKMNQHKWTPYQLISDKLVYTFNVMDGPFTFFFREAIKIVYKEQVYNGDHSVLVFETIEPLENIEDLKLIAELERLFIGNGQFDINIKRKDL